MPLETQPDGTPWSHDFGYTTMPNLPEVAVRRNGTFGPTLGRFVMWLTGFRLVGPYPDVPRLVIIGGPHTSNWDGIVGIAAILSLDLNVRIMVKHTMFRGPTGWILRRLGAIPIDRGVRGGVTRQMVERFEREERFILGVAPEGTRKKVERWKTGFYHIAEEAGVPILTVALDFGRRQIRLGPTVVPSGDLEADLAVMQSFVATAEGRNPENA